MQPDMSYAAARLRYHPPTSSPMLHGRLPCLFFFFSLSLSLLFLPGSALCAPVRLCMYVHAVGTGRRSAKGRPQASECSYLAPRRVMAKGAGGSRHRGFRRLRKLEVVVLGGAHTLHSL
ncbi:hypothetical protein J3F83DRAFT_746903 [Trichoderma novae-zelandiae]